MKRICVFCGSSPGFGTEYIKAAENLGHFLAERKIELVYGGAGIGIMGALADAVIGENGRVTGVIPQKLVEKEVAHSGLSDLRVVDSMHERKALMAELSDGFIALPGGLGTIEEFFEVLTWGQLGIHKKPCGLLDVNGYFRKLTGFLDHAVEQRFVEPEHRNMLQIEKNPEKLLEKFDLYIHPEIDKAKRVLKLSNG